MRRFALGLLLFASLSRAEEQERPVEVVVHDEKLERASRQDPSAASTVIRREELVRPGADAAGVLSRTPGVQVLRSGASADFATASLRGATSAQTPVYLSGIRLNDDVTGSADLSRIPLWMLDRVEVFRGSTPEGVDRLGIGGAVLFEPRFPRRTSLGAGLGFGSFDERAVWLGATVAAPGSSALVAVRRDQAQNDYEYLDDRGTAFTSSDDRVVRRQNADAASWDAWAIGRSELGSGARLTTVLNAYSREQGVTGIGVAPALSARGRVERLLAGLSARLPCSAGHPGEPRDRCELELSTTGLTARETLDDPNGELAIFARSQTSRGARTAEAAHVILRPSESLRLRAGASGEFERLDLDAVGGSSLRAGRQVLRSDASVRIAATDRLEMGVLGALERHATSGAGSDAALYAPSGRLGLVLRVVDGWRVLANVGRYQRVPTLGELHGSSAAVQGNPDLAPETGVNADAGIRVEHPSSRLSLWAEGFAFARWAEDLVAYRRSSFGTVRPYNIGRARLLGLELALAAQALGHLRLDAALTLLDPRDVTPGRTLVNDLVPYQSRLVANGRLEAFGALEGPVQRLALAASSSYRASRAADPAGLVVIGESWLLGADASLLTLGQKLTLRIAVDNVLDRPQLDVVGYPLPGRSYHASAELWW